MIQRSWLLTFARIIKLPLWLQHLIPSADVHISKKSFVFLFLTLVCYLIFFVSFLTYSMKKAVSFYLFTFLLIFLHCLLFSSFSCSYFVLTFGLCFLKFLPPSWSSFLLLKALFPSFFLLLFAIFLLIFLFTLYILPLLTFKKFFFKFVVPHSFSTYFSTCFFYTTFFLLSFLFFLNSFYLSYFNFTFLFCSSVLYFYSLFLWDPRLFSVFFHLILLSFFFSVCALTVWTPFAVLKLPLFCFPSVLSCLSSTFNHPHSFVTFVTLLCSFLHTRSFFSDFFFATLLFLTFPPVSFLLLMVCMISTSWESPVPSGGFVYCSFDTFTLKPPHSHKSKKEKSAASRFSLPPPASSLTPLFLSSPVSLSEENSTPPRL